MGLIPVTELEAHRRETGKFLRVDSRKGYLGGRVSHDVVRAAMGITADEIVRRREEDPSTVDGGMWGCSPDGCLSIGSDSTTYRIPICRAAREETLRQMREETGLDIGEKF